MMTLWWANKLKSKDDLHIGQILTIPPVTGLVVTVKAADTLDSHRRRYDVEVDDIVTENGLDGSEPRRRPGPRRPGRRGQGHRDPEAPEAGRQGATTTTQATLAAAVVAAAPSAARAPTTAARWSWPVVGGGNYISQYYHYGHYGLDIAADYGSPRPRGGRRHGHLRRLEEQRRRLPGLDRPRLRAVHDVQPHVGA